MYVKRRKIIAQSTVPPWHSGYVFMLIESLIRGSNPGARYNFLNTFFKFFFKLFCKLTLRLVLVLKISFTVGKVTVKFSVGLCVAFAVRRTDPGRKIGATVAGLSTAEVTNRTIRATTGNADNSGPPY